MPLERSSTHCQHLGDDPACGLSATGDEVIAVFSRLRVGREFSLEYREQVLPLASSECP